jgi:hypothetical protein
MIILEPCTESTGRFLCGLNFYGMADPCLKDLRAPRPEWLFS